MQNVPRHRTSRHRSGSLCHQGAAVRQPRAVATTTHYGREQLRKMAYTVTMVYMGNCAKQSGAIAYVAYK
ncbi:hypothetical protein VNO80_16096 [Phaseolus coccineus]|uniref:Uncharacterized protein n=1 Tax=Phaseolus coccineus TaxID=3886 RepID=A0AAN9MLU8_PHACN